MRDRTSALALVLTLGVVVAIGGCASTGSVPAPPERVNVGYGDTREGEVTGAISSLSGDALDAGRGFTRVEEMIRGRVAGVDVRRLPGGDYSLRVRGSRSLVGDNEPLVVVDGLVIHPHVTQMALAGINPGEVVRIDVLKDAGSTAAYGSRGANGVILITTRAFIR